MKAFGGGRLFSIMLTAALVAACGGGGGGDGGSVSPPPPPPATGTSTVVVGAITGFGSIFVNGIEFETTDATFTVDDNPGIESDLALGQVVRITGTVDDNGTTGSADDVTFDNSVEGPVESVDAAAGQIVVLGQTVVIDANTVFDDSFADPSIDGLAVGDFVEVSGFADANGVIRASRIEPTAAGEVEVHGVVAALDSAAHTFVLASLVVDYSGATLEDFASGAPADGDAVEVHGSSFGANGELIATRVQREDGGFDDVAGQDVQVEVEGLITRFASASDFDVAGQPVATNADTAFENGAAGDLALDVKVEAEGTVDANGVLQASKVSIRRENDARVAALVEAVDAAAGTLTVFGIPVIVDALTRFDDHSDADLRDFALGDVSVGDFVEVRGVESPDDAIVAAELRREDSDEEASVQGGVDDFSAEASLTILGVVVQVDAQTQYRDAADQPLTAAEFFAAIAVGTSVKAHGEQTGDGVLAASEVELEPED